MLRSGTQNKQHRRTHKVVEINEVKLITSTLNFLLIIQEERCADIFTKSFATVFARVRIVH